MDDSFCHLYALFKILDILRDYLPSAVRMAERSKASDSHAGGLGFESHRGPKLFQKIKFIFFFKFKFNKLPILFKKNKLFK